MPEKKKKKQVLEPPPAPVRVVPSVADVIRAAVGRVHAPVALRLNGLGDNR